MQKTQKHYSVDQLVSLALARGEGVLSSQGAVAVTTGKRTGRSPHDKFIVKDDITQDTVDWGPINQPIAPQRFQALWDKTMDYLNTKAPLTSHLHVGSDENAQIPITMITEKAVHHLFGLHMFVRDGRSDPDPDTVWTVVNAPGYATDPVADGVNSDASVLIDMTHQRVLICGMHYAGEMKKALFTVMNFILPDQDVLPMHCGANQGESGDTALFFGLSGTGKTTLSSDPDRYLIGDDEHGWGQQGIFNFEGGCYAKCIHLSQDKEPTIWQAIRDGALMENVVLDKANNPDFNDTRFTKNTRVAYPLTHVAKRVLDNRGGHPKSVILLTCDLYGVLPPVALLNNTQAAYYFLSGYTALVGSTEIGSTAEIQTTFSPCFGAPFFPRPAGVYARLLMKRLEQTGAKAYLVNTGWVGGGYHSGGKRFDIKTTRAVVTAIVNGQLHQTSAQHIPCFDFYVPDAIEGVPTPYLNPVHAWTDSSAFESNQAELIRQFIANFDHRFGHSEPTIAQAGPKLS